MFKGTPELIEKRREEIINACERLYQTMSFKEITLKEIGNVTSFSRPTIYNYFQTKEEIFLALFEREYDRWNEELEMILEENAYLTKAQVAEKIAHSLEKREQLLKLLSMNNYDMEANSRLELLTTFKAAYGKSMTNIRSILSRFCPEIGSEDISLDGYTTVYLGFPIWWGEEPRILDTFAESYDFSGITVIPFCTSGGSGIGRSGQNLADAAGSGNWLNGQRFSGSVSEHDLQSWITSLQ